MASLPKVRYWGRFSPRLGEAASKKRQASLNPILGAIGAILVTGVFCTAIAMSLYFAVVRLVVVRLVVVRRIGVTRSSLILLFFPVVAVRLGDPEPSEAFIGLAVIL